MLAQAIRDVKAIQTTSYEGRITAVEGLRIEAAGPVEALRLGAYARFGDPDGPRGELVGFNGESAIFLACDDIEGIRPHSPVYFSHTDSQVRVSNQWLGRVVDAFGVPVDGGPPIPSGGRARLVKAALG